MCGFSEIELVRLTRLRDRFRAGAWSATTNARPLVERHGIAMVAIPFGVREGGVVRYRCLLQRSDEEGERQLAALFQVAPVYSTPPQAGEVLTWLAGSVANSVLCRDLSNW